MNSKNSPTVRLAIVGAMPGHWPAYAPMAGEVLGTRLARHGYSVLLTSKYRQRFYRLADIAMTLIRHSKQIDVQILQVYGGLSFVGEDVASWLGRLLGQKIIMHLHGGAMPTFMARHPRWSRRVLRRAAAIVAPSPFLMKALASYDFDVRVIPNALDISLYPYRHREPLAPRLFWMRTFHDVYNPEMAVRVFARVKQMEPGATLVMAGQDKGTLSDVKRLAQEMNVLGGISFPGFLNSHSKIREASAADIFLNTNHIDNSPVSVIEACAFGLPVVATNVGGISDLLTHGNTALLVPDDDDRAMAEAIVRLLREPRLASHLSTAGRRLAERFSWERTAPQWDLLLAEVIDASAPRGTVQGAW